MKAFLLIFLFNSFCAHDIQVAFFKIHQEDENFIIEIIIEKDDVESTFSELDLELTDEGIQEYIQKNLGLSINDEKLHLSFEHMRIEDNHIYLNSNLKMHSTIKSVSLTNTCLLNIEDHSNIIELRLHDRERDFLMNSNRTTINIQY